jgi:predicted signal transduction protein with EAL and GGDEF domain
MLREASCDELQGYLFARPMPADDLEAWARARLQGMESSPRAARRDASTAA